MPASTFGSSPAAQCRTMAPTTVPVTGLPRPRGVLAGLLRITMLAACSRGADGVNGPARAASAFLPERTGQRLDAGVLTPNTLLRWDSDGEILYTGLDGGNTNRAQLRAIHVATGARRLIDSAPTRETQYGDFGMSRDGLHTFFQLSGALYYAVPDSAQVLIALVAQRYLPGDTRRISVLGALASGKVAYSTAPDSAWIFDAPTRTQRLVSTGCESVAAASPDGRQLLCLATSGATGSIIDIASGARSPTAAFSGPSFDIPKILSGPRGVEHIRTSPFELTDIVNLSTGTAITMIASKEDKYLDFTNIDNLDRYSFAWSKDGSRVAYSRDLCYARGFTCERTQSQLHVFNVDTKETRLAAVINRDIGSIAFSPDGSRIAYLTYAAGASSNMYIVPRP